MNKSPVCLQADTITLLYGPCSFFCEALVTRRAADSLTFGFNGRLDPSSVSSRVEVPHRYHSRVFGLRFLQRTEGVTVLHGLLITWGRIYCTKMADMSPKP